MEIILNDLLKHLDIIYIFMCNIITYLIINCFKKDISTGWKRAIGAVDALVLGVIFTIWLHHDYESIFCGFFIQFLMYDYVIKWFLNKIDTNKKDDTAGGE